MTTKDKIRKIIREEIQKMLADAREVKKLSEATPSDKAPAIDDYIKKHLGIDRVSSIKQNKCAICGKDAKKFKDKESEREYTISGMCQDCQDKFFD